MNRLDAIIAEARLLTSQERQRLVEVLERDLGCESEELAVGRRGLLYLANSAGCEDWSGFYPPTLGADSGSHAP